MIEVLFPQVPPEAPANVRIVRFGPEAEEDGTREQTLLERRRQKRREIARAWRQRNPEKARAAAARSNARGRYRRWLREQSRMAA